MAWKLTDNFKGRFNRIGHKGKKGPAHPRWKGGRIIDSDGYCRVYRPDHQWPRSNGYVLEHIYVVELGMGRRIAPNEIVHHKDHNRLNNSPENLELMRRGEHSRLHRKQDTKNRKRTSKGRFACGHI